ncbi:FAD-binding domain-containing protein [Aspergillus steynii IBT 23096]|uniref:FAD-binding domain-containing protein n=1 Tax=Aspergillus steynii IBT 23096 TaxID=1392250 RepID=A0A2I2FRG5_9EURO|nr:FAD-binding domain-containing protein [Aspergillus steynii IBT 23096]PLB43199.1 FAD-binding domain-containing protein [Aspergillus steynii IBT 23096]
MNLLRMYRAFALAVTPLLISLSATNTSDKHSCRCRPYEPCWPSNESWDRLNASINGNLVEVQPVGYVCHGNTFDQAACDNVKQLSRNAIWRAAQPGALQWSNFETYAPRNESCYVDSPKDTVCGQGRISRYAAEIETPEDVRAALKFARKHNIRLVVRNTGHDMAGKSSAPDSLQIATHRLKQIEYVSDFVPSGANAHSPRGPAVTMGAGVLGLELYTAAAAGKYLIISGVCSTVGTAGGYILGGGASTLNRLFGLASDNVLQFTMVTADGKLVVANEFQNENLFWALKGGGGGTFGVVMSVTVRVYPDVSVVNALLTITQPAGSETFWEAARDLFAAQPALAIEHNYIRVAVFPVASDDPSMGTLLVEGRLFNATVNTTDEKFAPLREALDSAGIPYEYQSEHIPSYSSYLTRPLYIEPAGGGTVHGSVLVSEQLYQSADGPSKLAEVVSKLQLGPGSLIESSTFGGGQVAANKDMVDSAVHPSWREALSLIDLYVNLPSNSSFEMQDKAQALLTGVQMPLLLSLEDGRMASYVNGADSLQENFQWQLWGDNYERLYQIKQAWDKDGLFICKVGVGSEAWDEEGMCRTKSSD